MRIVDLFAGPGGWDEGARMLGLTDALGIEWEPTACATAEAAGHARLNADIADLNPQDHGPITGLIASPPCQAWSLAGSGGGELDRAACHVLVDRMARGDDSLDWTDWTDERSSLVAQPVRWARELHPEWVAMEEVPAVLGLWEHIAHIFRGWGYNVWTGVLNAADYGVPQTRKRAILIASKVRPVGPPRATHTKEPAESLFDDTLLPWVSMAEALGWGFDEPSATVSGGGAATGGAEPFGNANYRRRLARIVTNQRSAGSDEYYSRSTDEPAPTLTTNARLWQLRDGERPPVYVNGNQANAARRSADEPAPTVMFGHRSNDVRWVLNSPATTIAGDPGVSPPGWRGPGERQHEHSVRITPQEAAALQSFPPDYPWQGSKTKQFEQIGNAVPPLLARAVLAEAAGISISKEAAA